MLPVETDGTLHLEQLDELAGEGVVKVVATGYVSNVLGGSNDVPRIAAWAHERGAIHVCDAAQAAPHKRVDVQALGSDFVAVSGHKMLGPSGIGFLWGRTELLRSMDPFLTGGHMIRRVRENESTWGELPHKFEAGTAPMAEAVGLGAAIDYLEAVGLEAIEQHEHELVAHALDRLAEIPGVTTWGPPPERRAGIVSFDVEGVHPHDVAQILDLDAVAIRAGHHCCQPLMHRLGVAATNRASFYLYTVPEEIDRLAAGLWLVKETFGVLEECDAHAEGQNPLCGDEVSIFVRFADDGETIDEVGFEGRGCAISQAATSMLTEMVKGRKAADVAVLPKDELLEEIGIPLTPIRLKCAILGLGVLKVALHRAKGTPLPAEWQGLADELDLDS